MVAGESVVGLRATGTGVQNAACVMAERSEGCCRCGPWTKMEIWNENGTEWEGRY